MHNYIFTEEVTEREYLWKNLGLFCVFLIHSKSTICLYKEV